MRLRCLYWARWGPLAIGIGVVWYLGRPLRNILIELPAVFELADQLKWGLIGMMGSVLVLGWVVERSIVRWELRAVGKGKYESYRRERGGFAEVAEEDKAQRTRRITKGALG